MKLFVISKPNFGDQLNLHLFPHLLGPIFDADASHLLLGIGTVIRPHVRDGSHEIILGAGAGYHRGRYSLNQRTVYAVRGPHTARLLRLPERLAGIDPGILVPRLLSADPAQASASRPAFMPHWQTERDAGAAWRKAAELADLDFISPLGECMAVLEQIRRAPLLITEALHGAIAAESYGIPWIPVVLGPKVLDFKWRDWCASIGIEYRPQTDLPILLDAGRPIAFRTHLRRLVATIGLGKAKWRFIPAGASTPADIERAAAALDRIAIAAEPGIHRGAGNAAERGTERLLDGIEAFRRDLEAGRFATGR